MWLPHPLAEPFAGIEPLGCRRILAFKLGQKSNKDVQQIGAANDGLSGNAIDHAIGRGEPSLQPGLRDGEQRMDLSC